MIKVINVGLAEVKTAKKPHVLATPSVGSCVVVILYDELAGIGSMAHIMLPDIKLAKAKKNRAKFANGAVGPVGVASVVKLLLGVDQTKPPELLAAYR